MVNALAHCAHAFTHTSGFLFFHSPNVKALHTAMKTHTAYTSLADRICMHACMQENTKYNTVVIMGRVGGGGGGKGGNRLEKKGRGRERG